MPTAANNLTTERLSFRTKLIYGLGDWGNTTTSTIFGFFFSFFLTDVALLKPGFAAPVLLVGGIWDAINDPLIGVWTDRMHSRWGRRRPFFLIGALPLTLSFILLFSVPPVQDQWVKMIYYMIVYILFDTSFTIISVPYTALTPELTEDYDERTRLNGYRMSVSMIGGLVAAVATPMIAGAFDDKRTGYFIMAIIFGVLAGLPPIMLFFNVKERYTYVDQVPMNVFRSFLYTWKNRAFRYAAGIYLTAWATVNLVAALFQYFLTYWMNMADQLEIVLGIVQIGALICVPIMVWMSGKFGKQRAYIIGVSWWVLVMLGLAFLPPQAKFLTYFLAAAAGLGIAGAHVIPWSIIPDVIEADELATGQRREGIYYGFLVFLQKSGTAFALALVQVVLSLTGYTPDAVQPQSALTAIRVMIGPLPAVLLAISIFLTARYPINRVKHAEMRAALAQKRMENK